MYNISSSNSNYSCIYFYISSFFYWCEDGEEAEFGTLLVSYNLQTEELKFIVVVSELLVFAFFSWDSEFNSLSNLILFIHSLENEDVNYYLFNLDINSKSF